MELRYNKATLAKLEDLLSEAGFQVRYEKGQFQGGYCVLREQELIMVNAFYPLEGRVNCLVDLALELVIEPEKLTERSAKLYAGLQTLQARS